MCQPSGTRGQALALSFYWVLRFCCCCLCSLSSWKNYLRKPVPAWRSVSCGTGGCVEQVYGEGRSGGGDFKEQRGLRGVRTSQDTEFTSPSLILQGRKLRPGEGRGPVAAALQDPESPRAQGKSRFIQSLPIIRNINEKFPFSVGQRGHQAKLSWGRKLKSLRWASLQHIPRVFTICFSSPGSVSSFGLSLAS